MKASEHLTTNQIAAFSAGSLATSDSRTVGGHLIRCLECRTLLPMPDPTKVWTAITSDHDFEESSEAREAPSLTQTYAHTAVGLFGKQNRFAWAGGMLVIVVSLAALFIFSLWNPQENETQMARSFELENPVPASNNNGPDVGNSAVLGSPEESDRPVRETTPTTGGGGLRERRARVTGIPTDRLTTSGVKKNISSTRGATLPCTIGKTIEVEHEPSKADLILRWKPVPNAAKYHLFVSDDSEVLVDEFETDQDTSYVLKTRLDPAKSYKWKIVITLLSGQKLYVDAQKFTPKDFQRSLSGYKSKSRSNTRCLAN